jgi:opacity protein-like surface antigen
MRVRSSMRWEWVVGTLLVTVVVSPARAADGTWSRAHRLEAFPMIQFLGGDEAPWNDGADDGKIEDTVLFGGGLGFNLNDHLNINGDLTVGRTEVVLSPPGYPDIHYFTQGATLWLGDINLDYNILKNRLTPLVTGGIGFAKWRNHAESVGEIHWAYNLGAGVRWDFTDNLALRVIYRSTWTELTYADETLRFNGVVASLIYMFK